MKQRELRELQKTYQDALFAYAFADMAVEGSRVVTHEEAVARARDAVKRIKTRLEHLLPPEAMDEAVRKDWRE